MFKKLIIVGAFAYLVTSKYGYRILNGRDRIMVMHKEHGVPIPTNKEEARAVKKQFMDLYHQ